MTEGQTIADVLEGRADWVVVNGRRHNWRGQCHHCGATFTRYKRASHPAPRFCSKSCSTTETSNRPEVKAARTRRGERSNWWRGDEAKVRSGRSRALRNYPDTPAGCERCGRAVRLDRHHKDGDTLNNARENIAFLCRRCHMTVDGRIDSVREHMRVVQPIGAKASAEARRGHA